MKIRWSSVALKRATDVVDYIAEDSPVAAEQWIEGLLTRIEGLRAFPQKGRTVPELQDPKVRELIYGEYRIVYQVTEREVHILTVRHGRRLLDAHELMYNRE